MKWSPLKEENDTVWWNRISAQSKNTNDGDAGHQPKKSPFTPMDSTTEANYKDKTLYNQITPKAENDFPM